MLPAQPNQSLLDGLQCLQIVASSHDPVGVRELARKMDKDPTRINRLLKTLAHTGYLHQTNKRKYTSGPGIHALSTLALFSSGMMRGALPPLEALSEHQLTVALGVLWNGYVSYLYYHTPDMTVADGIGRMSRTIATQSSIGTILMANMSVEEVTAMYETLPAFALEAPPQEKLMQKLEICRSQNFAMLETSEDPINKISIAVALSEPQHVAIAMAGDISTSQVPAILHALRKAAYHISENTYEPKDLTILAKTTL